MNELIQANRIIMPGLKKERKLRADSSLICEKNKAYFPEIRYPNYPGETLENFRNLWAIIIYANISKVG